PVDLPGTYLPLVTLTGQGFEPDPPALRAVTFPGLAMPRLLLLAGRYPSPEGRLPKLQAAIRESGKPPLQPLPRRAPPRSFLSPKDFDVFNPAGRSAGHGGVPEHCLLRVFDVTVEPGRTYQYRLRVRIAKSGPAARGAGRAAEAVSAWYELPGAVT